MKQTILFLAANPLGTDRIALDREARAIQVELERSGSRGRFELVTRWAAEPLDLLHELRKLRPRVVHFRGHGLGPEPDLDLDPGHSDADAPPGLLFQGPDGRSQLVSAEALDAAFGAAGSSVQLIVLSACYSERNAQALLRHASCVVGMSGAIADDAARSFAIGFYGGLGEGESIATAYAQGCAAISLQGLADRDRPRLAVRADRDAGKLVLAAEPAEAPSNEGGAGTALAGDRPSAALRINGVLAAVRQYSGEAPLALVHRKGDSDLDIQPHILDDIPTMIGRGGRTSEESRFELPHTSVSERHARIIQVNNVLMIEDLGSTNGTFVNGFRIRLFPIKAGDRICFGRLAFSIHKMTTRGHTPPQTTAPSRASAPRPTTLTPESEGCMFSAAILVIRYDLLKIALPDLEMRDAEIKFGRIVSKYININTYAWRAEQEGNLAIVIASRSNAHICESTPKIAGEVEQWLEKHALDFRVAWSMSSSGPAVAIQQALESASAR